jgi:hypothetical protein
VPQLGQVPSLIKKEPGKKNARDTPWLFGGRQWSFCASKDSRKVSWDWTTERRLSFIWTGTSYVYTLDRGTINPCHSMRLSKKIMSAIVSYFPATSVFGRPLSAEWRWISFESFLSISAEIPSLHHHLVLLSSAASTRSQNLLSRKLRFVSAYFYVIPSFHERSATKSCHDTYRHGPRDDTVFLLLSDFYILSGPYSSHPKRKRQSSKTLKT